MAWRDLNSSASGSQEISGWLSLSGGAGESQVSHPDQVVGGHGKGPDPQDPFSAPVSHLSQDAHGLDPAKGLLHQFAQALTDGVAGFSDNGFVQNRSPALAGHMRLNPALPQKLTKLTLVILLVRPQGKLWGRGQTVDHGHGRFPLGGAAGQGEDPGFLVYRRASGSVVEAWVALRRRSPRKSTSGTRNHRVGHSRRSAWLSSHYARASLFSGAARPGGGQPGAGASGNGGERFSYHQGPGPHIPHIPQSMAASAFISAAWTRSSAICFCTAMAWKF